MYSLNGHFRRPAFLVGLMHAPSFSLAWRSQRARLFILIKYLFYDQPLLFVSFSGDGGGRRQLYGFLSGTKCNDGIRWKCTGILKGFWKALRLSSRWPLFFLSFSPYVYKLYCFPPPECVLHPSLCGSPNTSLDWEKCPTLTWCHPQRVQGIVPSSNRSYWRVHR